MKAIYILIVSVLMAHMLITSDARRAKKCSNRCKKFFENKIDSLEERLQAQTEELNDLKSDNQELQSAVESLNKTVKQLQDQLAANPKTLCYDKYGCYENFPPQSRELPQEPSKVGTKFHLFTRRNRETPQIIDDEDESKLRASNFNISRRAIFVVHGYFGSIKTWAEPMRDALLDQENCNVILVDWSQGAKDPYTQAVGNTRLVGAQIAVLIGFLISSNNGSPLMAGRFYIVGHSLGAQAAGYAGSNLRANGVVLGRITGLDPAGPYFTNYKENVRLDPSDARYVDVIHTDAGGFGTPQKVGHIDFFPNGGSKQPVCESSTVTSCDHSIAHAYYTASVKGQCSWTAYPCSSYKDFEKGTCLTCNEGCPEMGYDADRTKKTGTYYLKTDSIPPFCSITPKGR